MILDHELHLHLHGCVEADDFWQLGKASYKQNYKRLQWYADEFEKHWGRRPLIDQYFADEKGFVLFKEDYELKNYVTFHQFQAKFNLLIALLPIAPTDTTLIEFVLRKQAKRGIRYGEYRISLPNEFDEAQTQSYLTHATKAFQRISSESQEFAGKAVVSLNRDNKYMLPAYGYIKSWQKKNEELSEFLVGIDFGNYEEAFAPATKQDFLKTVLRDNAQMKNLALAVLYHVGESFKTIGIEKSIEWVVASAQIGCHRLGHCISLGVNPCAIVGNDFSGDADKILRLQDDAMAAINSAGAIVESCPTSNIRIAGIESAASHPLPRFLEQELPTIISTDDPGIFGITMADEEQLCIKEIGITQEQLTRCNRTATSSKSEIISGRRS